MPGASGHSLSTRPLTSLALQVPQVPVPHSYGSSTPLRSPAWRIFSPGSHSNSHAPLRAATTTFMDDLPGGGSPGQLPLEPRGERAPHDQLLVARGEPRQLLGEQ